MQMNDILSRGVKGGLLLLVSALTCPLDVSAAEPGKPEYRVGAIVGAGAQMSSLENVLGAASIGIRFVPAGGLTLQLGGGRLFSSSGGSGTAFWEGTIGWAVFREHVAFQGGLGFRQGSEDAATSPFLLAEAATAPRPLAASIGYRLHRANDGDGLNFWSHEVRLSLIVRIR